MFYTQSFLARKGPLSTVWMAAHLQHSLKKSHYTTTHIPSIVMRIMDPGVPIALRMSGHLLLGVVRIYSKKVEYLHQDCKDALTGLHKAFATLQLAQPEEVRPVPFQSVTLPGTVDLDTQNIDDQIDYCRAEDLHMRNPEDITLTDQIPVTTDHYVTVSFDEDITIYSSHTEVLPDSGPIPMEEDIILQCPSTNVVSVEDHGQSTQKELPTIQHTAGLGFSVHSPPQATQAEPTEVRRRPSNDHYPGNPPRFSNRKDNDVETNNVPEKVTVPETIPETVSEMVSPSQQQFNPPTPPTSQARTSDGENNSPSFELCESPPIQQPQRRGRKRKQFLDDIAVVLTNKFMRSALNNTRDILRKRRDGPSLAFLATLFAMEDHVHEGSGSNVSEKKRERRDVPSSSLGTWKLNNSRRKEQNFYQPLLNGISEDLLDISTSEYVRSRTHLVIPEMEHNCNVAVTPPPTVPVHNVVEDDYRSNDRRDDLTVASLHNVSVVSERMQTLDSAASPGAHGSENMQMPVERMQTPDSDTDHLINSTETDELGFLTMENNTPVSSQGTSGSAKLSKRTWHAAEYLKRLSPISLNNILEGKTRHIAARMFFEVLVLKTNELVHVQQEQPYGDISLKLAPTLSNAQS